MALLVTPFSELTRVCTNRLPTKLLSFKIVELEIWLCARRQGESLAFTVDSLLEQSLVNDSSANTVYIY